MKIAQPCVSRLVKYVNLDFKPAVDMCRLKSILARPKPTYTHYPELTKHMSHHLTKMKIQYADLIRVVCAKPLNEAIGEVDVTIEFLDSFCGNAFNQLNASRRSADVTSVRVPYGDIGIINPFNFPLEIPVLQMMGALYMGNRVFMHTDNRVQHVVSKFVDQMVEFGLPKDLVTQLSGDKSQVEQMFQTIDPKVITFTGSSTTANHLSKVFNGNVYVEDSGFNFKVLDPNVELGDKIVKQCFKDMFGYSGQKCSAQSLLFLPKHKTSEFIHMLLPLINECNFEDCTLSPTMSVSNDKIKEYINFVLSHEGSQLCSGGKALPHVGEEYIINQTYGTYSPTCLYVPIEHLQRRGICEEIFAPVSLITEYEHLNDVVLTIRNLKHNLTTGIVSENPQFINVIVKNTHAGVVYTGLNARTTGAPSRIHFGTHGAMRSGAIGTPEAIIKMYSWQREIVGPST